MQRAPSRHISRMISVFQKIDFFLQLADDILDECVGGDLGIMAYHRGEVPCETRRLSGRARDVNRGDIRAVWAAGDPPHEAQLRSRPRASIVLLLGGGGWYGRGRWY